MKALKSTGLVPIKFLVASGPYAKDQIAGLDPAKVKQLKASKNPIIEEVPAGKDENGKPVETIDIDDNSLAVIPESPMLGGYDHTPPLGSDRLPGRNRFVESEVPTGVRTPQGPASPVSVENDDRGTFEGETLINGGDDAGSGAADSGEPPVPPTAKKK